MTHSIAAFVAPPLTENSSTANIQVGTRIPLSDGGSAVYVQATSTLDKYNAAVIGVDYSAVNATTTAVTEATGTSLQVGWAQVTISASNYGWLRTSGRPIGKLAANCADRVALFTTATEGVLDDAVVSIGQLAGVVSKTTISNATAVTLIVPTDVFVKTFAVQA